MRNQVDSTDAGMQSRITDAFIDRLKNAGHSTNQIASIVNPKTGAGIARQQELVQEHLPGILRELGFGQMNLGQAPSDSNVLASPVRPRSTTFDAAAQLERLQTPNTGNHAAVSANAETTFHDRFVLAENELNRRSSEINNAQFEREMEVVEGANRAVSGALLERGADLIGLGSFFSSDEAGGPIIPGDARVADRAGMPSSFALQNGGSTNSSVMGPAIRPGVLAGAPMMQNGTGLNAHDAPDTFYQAPNVSYELAGKIRDQPVDHGIMATLSQSVSRMGGEYGMVVTSGGQPSEGHDRTGSHRHDHGGAVDFYLTRNGEKLLPNDHKEEYAALIRDISAVLGIGHYSWGIHAGGGTPAFWGPDTTSATADPVLAKAYAEGRG